MKTTDCIHWQMQKTYPRKKTESNEKEKRRKSGEISQCDRLSKVDPSILPADTEPEDLKYKK